MTHRDKASSLFWLCLLCSSFLIYSEGLESGSVTGAWNSALDKFFGSIDKDGDGQIEPSEAKQYIDANFDRSDIHVDASKAAQQMSKNLDGSDSDATISKNEVEGHLRRLLKGNRVADWLKHSAQMPQYVQAFKQNSITSLDFPTLVADGGEVLRSDLGVTSKLHHEQLVRALKRVMLGIGTPPFPPLDLQAIPVRCDAVALKWQAPQKLGQPPLHKYNLERQGLAGPQGAITAPVWETANGDIDDEDTAFVDQGIQAGVYRYRLTAWNAVGWSEYAYSQECSTADLSLPCPPGRCWRDATCEGETPPLASRQEVEGSWGHVMGWQLPLPLVVAGALLLAGAPLLGYMGRQNRKAAFDVREKPIQVVPEEQATDGLAVVDTVRSGSGGEGRGVLEGKVPPPVKVKRSVSEGQGLHIERAGSAEARALGSSRGPSPTKKAPPRGDIFHPGDLEGFRDLSNHDLGLPPGLRQPSKLKGSHAGYPEAQDVVWLDDEGQPVNAPPASDIPASPQSPGRHGCAFPSCEKALHPLFNPRSALTSHYCSICQSVFCHRHTRYSPHGKLGSCGMESKCICNPCFDDLPRITQERLEKSNKLQQKAKKEGPGVATPQLSGGSGSNRSSPDKRRAGSIFGNVFGSSNSMASSHESPLGRERDELNNRPSLGGRSGAQQWARLRTAWKATMQFQGAGVERKRRKASLSNPAPLPPAARSARRTQ